MKKLAVIALSSLLAVSVVGCGKASDTTEPKSSGEAKGADTSKKLTISLLAPSFAGGGWPSDNAIIQKLDEKLNIELQIQWVPADTVAQKLNVMAASNSFPDAYWVQQNEFIKWRDKNIFMDIKPVLSQYPNLSKQITAEALQLNNPKDKYYGLPYYIQDTRDSLAIRQDWLDKLGLKMPTTVDEFAEVATAFATKDPDGNGQQDTSGFSFGFLNNKFTGAGPIMAAFGLGNEWIKSGDQLVNFKTQNKEMKQFVTYLNKMYQSGALDKDFATNKVADHKDKFVANKVGIAEFVPGELLTTSFQTLKKAQPNAAIAQVIPPKGPDGKQGTTTNSMTTAKVVINNAIDKDKQQRILKMLDYMVSDEGYDLIKNGIENVHYKSDNGKIVKLDAYDKERPQLLSIWFFRRFDPLIQMHKWEDPNLVKQLEAWNANNAKYPWQNQGAEVLTESQSKLGPNIDQKWIAAITKIIMGQAPVDSVDQAAADWLKNGGEQITKDVNEEYKKLKN
ncbi:ABC transporter substrate-binding protein [Paenibacillus sp. 2RAB27]|uniref:extracellular solute-binding protein n=1 Tax=Paenibacillus sp. 2RAB27 TaxID=3232991 RepID=UPI003F96D6C2